MRKVYATLTGHGTHQDVALGVCRGDEGRRLGVQACGEGLGEVRAVGLGQRIAVLRRQGVCIGLAQQIKHVAKAVCVHVVRGVELVEEALEVKLVRRAVGRAEVLQAQAQARLQRQRLLLLHFLPDDDLLCLQQARLVQ